MGDVAQGCRVDRLWHVKRFVGFLTFVSAGTMLLGACVDPEGATLVEPDRGAAPPPTIGIDSDLGVPTGGAEVRTIEASDVESVVMIGDSITVGAQPLIEERFADLGFEDVDVIAQELKRTTVSLGDNSSGADIAAFVASGDDEGDEQLWVVALGTNDISQYSSIGDVASQVRSVLDQIPDEAPVVWINTYFANRPDDTALVNLGIDQALVARGNSFVGRWDQVAGEDGVLRSDGVHPNDDGAKVFAAFVTDTVTDFLEPN